MSKNSLNFTIDALTSSPSPPTLPPMTPDFSILASLTAAATQKTSFLPSPSQSLTSFLSASQSRLSGSSLSSSGGSQMAPSPISPLPPPSLATNPFNAMLSFLNSNTHSNRNSDMNNLKHNYHPHHHHQPNPNANHNIANNNTTMNNVILSQQQQNNFLRTQMLLSLISASSSASATDETKLFQSKQRKNEAIPPVSSWLQTSPSFPSLNSSIETTVSTTTTVKSPSGSNGISVISPRPSSSSKPPSSGTPGVNRFSCESCGKTYATVGGLTKHQQFHCTARITKTFGCKHCDKGYSSLGALKMHIRTHTLPCRCQLCGKAFSRPWLLQGHIRTHTGERPFSCNQCGRAFADRSNLRAHCQTHSHVKRYACSGCSKTFSRLALLSKHTKTSCPNSHQLSVAAENRSIDERINEDDMDIDEKIDQNSENIN